jgi:hypothetical protein
LDERLHLRGGGVGVCWPVAGVLGVAVFTLMGQP